MKAIARDLASDGFRAARATYTATFVTAARRESANVALYLMLRDDRRGSGGLRADLWCAPIDAPDDRIDNIGVGYKIFIHQVWQDTEEAFLTTAILRAKLLAGHAASLVAAVEQELASPVILTRRFSIWRAERALLAAARNSTSLGPLYGNLVAAAAASNNGKGSHKAVAQAADTLLASAAGRSALKHEIAALPNAEMAGRALVDQVQIETLLASSGA